MKIIVGLIILFLIKLSSGRVERIYNKWQIEIYSSSNKTICNGVPIKPRLFITDAKCINNSLKADSKIRINYMQPHYTSINVAKVKNNNILYNENFTTEYNESKQNVAVVLTNEPVVSDNNRSLLTFMAQYLYDKNRNYNEQFQLANLSNDQEIDNSSCVVPTLNGILSYHLVSCFVFNNSIWCSYDPDKINDWDNERINFVFCNLKKSDKDVLVGIIPEPSQRQNMTVESPLKHSRNSAWRRRCELSLIKRDCGFDRHYVKIEYVGDLHDAIETKYNTWLTENPNLLTYAPYEDSGDIVEIPRINS